MIVSPDTNVLVRSIVQDDPAQAKLADELLAEAEAVTISIHALCELVWVLRKVYLFSRENAISALRKILNIDNVSTDWDATEAGLAALESGADFADGVIAHQGRQLGGDAFVSFDRKAVTAMEKQGFSTRLLR